MGGTSQAKSGEFPLWTGLNLTGAEVRILSNITLGVPLAMSIVHGGSLLAWVQKPVQ